MSSRWTPLDRLCLAVLLLSLIVWGALVSTSAI